MQGGQRSVIWLKLSQPCLHHPHVLSTTFSWQPLSLFSLWIILLTWLILTLFCCSVKQLSVFVVFGYPWLLCKSLFLHNLGQQCWWDIQPLDHSFSPIPPPFILPLINQCDRYLVPLAWGLMAGGRGFSSHGGITLFRGWLWQRCKSLDVLDTHLHLVTQLLKAGKWEQGSCILPPTSTCYCSTFPTFVLMAAACIYTP